MTRSLDENFSVLVLVFNTFEHDARVERAAETAAQMGADVTVLCLSGLGLSSRESRGSYVVNRIGSAGNGARKDIQAHTGRRARLKASLRRQWHKMQAARNSKLYRGPVWLGERLLANRAFRMRRTEYQMLADAAVRFCAGQSFDFIHANDFKGLYAAFQIHQKFGTPYLFDSHELWVERNRGGAYVSAKEKHWEREFEGVAMAASAAGVTVCESIAEYLAEHYSIEKPVVVRNIPQALSETAGQSVTKSAIRSQLGVSNGEFLMVYVGKSTTNRGLIDVLRAMVKVDSSIKLLVLGYFDHSFELYFTETVRRLDLTHRVIVRGPVRPEEIATWISPCDLSLVTINGVCLSYQFALPNKLLESIHALVPILGTDLPEITKIVRHYGCGMTVPDGDVDALANAMTTLFADREALSRMRRGAVAAASELTWEREKRCLVETYERVLKGPGETQ